MEKAYITKIVDGDTFYVGKERVRLENLDAPEMKECGGIKCKEKLTELICNKEIEYITKARDKYTRLIVEVWVGGANINKIMGDYVESLNLVK
jgi:endonuclease YncB( thermonuclease family)